LAHGYGQGHLAFVALTVLEGKLRATGAVYPEALGLDEEISGAVLTRLAVNGMGVSEEEFSYSAMPLPLIPETA